ncbi:MULTISPECIES: XkdX family protein [unclassified Lactobacillus]|uniref:XkdX family protein n=1 Tax=unclassified Lactobacillus TaxID=2620435 RepID=UPI002269B2FC|nr:MULTISPECIES: XkdX family protein [unclassified Lactobacillus]MCX8721211.1 XkdX family protein [Lactobacillus sp. B4010]MCX8731961.1 XkdX family protein [Lactobacillus sp. B4015]MCX8734352.1 XkdX family protein [Lactobacillus sp. B4012]
MLNIFKNLATQFYNAGWYDKTIIASFVQVGALTADDYQEITGEKYATPNA